MRILFIEDDNPTVMLVQLMLKSEGYLCDTVNLGLDSLEIASIYNYDLIILDLMLPDMDGYDVLKKLRTQCINTPVLILSGLIDPANKVKGLEYGADDYLTKPFNRNELIARVQSVIRRSKGHSSLIIKIHKNIVVDMGARMVRFVPDGHQSGDGKEIKLTWTEYSILQYLSVYMGKVLSKDMLLNMLYGGIDEPEAKIIDVFICKLRKKLSVIAGNDAAEIIQTVWGRGYVLSNDSVRSANSNVSNEVLQNLDVQR
ncbi:response regulator transcription factor [Candidatus Gromoviella agglomerans]|uniref:response regulator transcription factor n=1 Tax=Candidatus Gromoviella agglomerans TaxID=2806609 RepID=UPI001E58BB10|nr:response regulator transcription factor [Candidatus Gromoviella agglomerans]UFX98612.1 DNA-binding response regulator family protein [Candidatus Gromoviella agglomerans]